jgi:riboflavin synthase
MFTGLIGWVGRLESLADAGAQARLAVDARGWSAEPALGDSIAVQGVCLTLVGRAGGRFEFDVLRRTLEVTALARKRPGAALNLELALRLGDPLGGHLVTGHVDGLAHVRGWRLDGPDRVLTLAAGPALLAQLVPKGSVALDGVSLTVADLGPDSFEVRVIPHTWSHTSLRERQAGDAVNLETDALGKYARRPSAARADKAGRPLDLQRLLDAGFTP